MKIKEIKEILYSIVDAKPSEYQNYGKMAKDFRKKAEQILKLMEEQAEAKYKTEPQELYPDFDAVKEMVEDAR